MQKCQVTVVTTTYNQEKYIEDCIKGIINQKTKFKYQLIISDDCSTDKTRDIIKKYANQYPDIIKPVFREKNLGAMQNFIETLNEVHTKYVALCDGDDFWCDNKKLQRQYDFLESHPDYFVSFHKTLIFFEDGSRQEEEYPKLNSNTLLLKDLIKENVIPANSVMYRWVYKGKDSLKKDFPTDIVPGDFFLHLIHANKGKIHFINKVMSNYRRQSSGMWYLSSQKDKQDLFYDIYGERYLKFFRSVEEKLSLDSTAFEAQKIWILQNTLVAYINLKKFKKFKELYIKENQRNKEEFNKYMMSFGKKNKIKVLLMTNPLLLFKLIIKYILRRIHFIK